MGRGELLPFPSGLATKRGIAELCKFTGKSGVGQPFGRQIQCCTGGYDARLGG